MLGKCFRRLVCLNQIIYLLLRWWKIVQFWKALCLVFNCVCTVSKSMKLLTYSYIPMCSKQSFTQFYKLYMYITYVWSPSFSVWVSVSLSHSESVNVHVYVQATCTHLYLSHSLNTHTLSHTHTRTHTHTGTCKHTASATLNREILLFCLGIWHQERKLLLTVREQNMKKMYT